MAQDYRTANFFIEWDYLDEPSFQIEILFHDVVRGRQIRAAIAERVNKPAEVIEIEMLKGTRKSDGETVVLITKEGSLLQANEGLYVDGQCEEVKQEDIDGDELVEINDEDEVPTRGLLDVWILAHKC